MSVMDAIRKAGTELRSPYNDGYVQFGIKKDLYEIKWLVDELLAGSAVFEGEKEFLEHREQAVVWNKLKR